MQTAAVGFVLRKVGTSWVVFLCWFRGRGGLSVDGPLQIRRTVGLFFAGFGGRGGIAYVAAITIAVEVPLQVRRTLFRSIPMLAKEFQMMFETLPHSRSARSPERGYAQRRSTYVLARHAGLGGAVADNRVGTTAALLKAGATWCPLCHALSRASFSSATALLTAHHGNHELQAAACSFELGILVGQPVPSIVCVSW